MPHGSFDLHFSNSEWCGAYFHLFIGHLHVLFGEMPVYIFSPFFDWIGCFSGIKLYELLIYFEINPLSVSLFAVIFSHSEGCLLILFIVFWIVQKLLSLIVAQTVKNPPAIWET